MSTEIPTPEVFFLETPPYTRFEITASNFSKVEQIELFKGTLDTHCMECGKSSVFRFRLNKLQEYLAGGVPFFVASPGTPVGKQTARKSVNSGDNTSSKKVEPWQKYASYSRVFPIEFECTRDSSHALYFFIRIQDAEIMKIGQYPSLADLQGVEIEKYRKILGDARYREFNRAIGLISHGVGIGAFVYLRRIFESLIEEAHSKAIQNPSWDEDIFVKSRTEERIKLLQKYLPTFLVKNWSIYSILSKGIHDLTEEECLEYFKPLHLGIELILDEKMQQVEKDKKTSQTEKLIAVIKSKLE